MSDDRQRNLEIREEIREASKEQDTLVKQSQHGREEQAQATKSHYQMRREGMRDPITQKLFGVQPAFYDSQTTKPAAKLRFADQGEGDADAGSKLGRCNRTDEAEGKDSITGKEKIGTGRLEVKEGRITRLETATNLDFRLTYDRDSKISSVEAISTDKAGRRAKTTFKRTSEGWIVTGPGGRRTPLNRDPEFQVDLNGISWKTHVSRGNIHHKHTFALDGTRTQENGSGLKIVSKPDGTVLKRQPDGSTEISYRDRSGVEKDKNGKITSLKTKTGTTIKVNYDGNRQINEIVASWKDSTGNVQTSTHKKTSEGWTYTSPSGIQKKLDYEPHFQVSENKLSWQTVDRNGKVYESSVRRDGTRAEHTRLEYRLAAEPQEAILRTRVDEHGNKHIEFKDRTEVLCRDKTSITRYKDHSQVKRNSNGDAVEIKDAKGRTFSITYDAQQQINGVTFPDGRRRFTEDGGKTWYQSTPGMSTVKNPGSWHVDVDRQGNLSYENAYGGLTTHYRDGRFVRRDARGQLRSHAS